MCCIAFGILTQLRSPSDDRTDSYRKERSQRCETMQRSADLRCGSAGLGVLIR